MRTTTKGRILAQRIAIVGGMSALEQRNMEPICSAIASKFTTLWRNRCVACDGGISHEQELSFLRYAKKSGMAQKEMLDELADRKNTNCNEATLKANKLCEQISELVARLPRGCPVSISSGVGTVIAIRINGQEVRI